MIFKDLKKSMAESVISWTIYVTVDNEELVRLTSSACNNLGFFIDKMIKIKNDRMAKRAKRILDKLGMVKEHPIYPGRNKVFRNKRSLMPMLGTLASHLFGVMDENDKDRIHTALRHSAMSFYELATWQSINTNIIKSIVDDSKINLNKTAENFLKIKDAIEELSGDQKLFKDFIIFDEFLNEIEQVTDELIQKLLILQNSAQKEQLDPLILPAEDLEKTLKEITKIHGDFNTIPFELSELLSYYRLKSRILLFEDRITFELKIPLKNKINYKLFEIIYVTNSISIATKEKLVFNIKENILALESLGSQKYLLYSKEELSKCEILSKSILCTSTKQMAVIKFDRGVGKCITETYLNLPTRNVGCKEFLVKESSQVSNFERISETSWFYTVNKIVLSLRCHNKQYATKEISGIGMIHVELDCLILSDIVDLYPIKNFHEDFNSRLFTNMQDFPSKAELEKNLKDNKDIVLEFETVMMDEFKKIEENLMLSDMFLNRSASMVKDFSEDMWSWSPQTIMVVVLGIVSTLATLSITFLVAMKAKRIYMIHQTMPNAQI